MSKNESFRDHISTINEDGSRKWIYPKKPKGRFYNRRKVVSAILLIILFSGPFIRIGGEPLLMLNILERKFVLFGQIFWPQDFYIAAFAFIVTLIGITLFTVVFGRLFCGWVCPQTIFMEMVFRRIEYWLEGDYVAQQKLTAAKWDAKKIRIKASKHLIFYLISFLISNTFLMYIIGSEELIKIITDPPAEHILGLSLILIFSFVFYAVFAFMREQVCTTVCPYGRLQGVLLDKHSYNVAYDHERGEPRGKGKERSGLGDCVDCGLCVRVCPTGIDIRNGTQLECVNCTACIDACDEIMDATEQPRGLIRYTSEEAIEKKVPFSLSTRAKAYVALLAVLTAIFSFILVNRSDVEVNILRSYGTTFEKLENGDYVNFYTYRMLNKTQEIQKVTFSLLGKEGKVTIIGMDTVKVQPQESVEGTILVTLPNEEVEGLKTNIEIRVIDAGKVIDEQEVYFSGPFKLKSK